MVKYEINNLIQLREATQKMGDFLMEHGVPCELAFDSRLIVCELATNVVKHSESVARIEVCVTEKEILLTVYAKNGSLPPVESVCSEVTAESGRGLYLVDKLSVKRRVTEDGGVRVVIAF